jgi:transposase
MGHGKTTVQTYYARSEPVIGRLSAVQRRVHPHALSGCPALRHRLFSPGGHGHHGLQSHKSHEQIHDLAQHLHAYTPEQLFGTSAASPGGQFWTVEDLARAVEGRYGVLYRSRSSYLSLLQRCGFSYQRPERAFKSRRETQVAAFQEQLEKN